MKNFIRRDHAERLKRQYMSMGLGHDIMLGLYNRDAHSHKAFLRQGLPQNLAAARDPRASDNEQHGSMSL